MTLGASNISFGMPDRHLINVAYLAMMITAGVTCPVVNVANVRANILAIDLLLGKDKRARRYIEAFKVRNAAAEAAKLAVK
jgi:5-methyltetrahydrofolate--homocysteine methyltransferase